MDFSVLDPSTIGLLIIETIITLAMIALAGISLFRIYKGKNKLTVEEVLNLGEELMGYAKYVYDNISELSDISRSNFSSDKDYKEYLVEKVVEDLDEVITEQGKEYFSQNVIDIYTKINHDDKIKIIESIIDRIPSNNTDSNDEVNQSDDTHDSISVDNDDESDSNTVDIGEFLN